VSSADRDKPEVRGSGALSAETTQPTRTARGPSPSATPAAPPPVRHVSRSQPAGPDSHPRNLSSRAAMQTHTGAPECTNPAAIPNPLPSVRHRRPAIAQSASWFPQPTTGTTLCPATKRPCGPACVSVLHNCACARRRGHSRRCWRHLRRQGSDLGAACARTRRGVRRTVF